MVSTNSEQRWRRVHLYEGEVYMKFQNITVSGIVNIVINRKTKWVQKGAIWETSKDHCCHEQMMNILTHLKEDRRYRMWVHGDTLNIVRK